MSRVNGVKAIANYEVNYCWKKMRWLSAALLVNNDQYFNTSSIDDIHLHFPLFEAPEKIPPAKGPCYCNRTEWPHWLNCLLLPSWWHLSVDFNNAFDSLVALQGPMLIRYAIKVLAPSQSRHCVSVHDNGTFVVLQTCAVVALVVFNRFSSMSNVVWRLPVLMCIYANIPARMRAPPWPNW